MGDSRQEKIFHLSIYFIGFVCANLIYFKLILNIKLKEFSSHRLQPIKTDIRVSCISIILLYIRGNYCVELKYLRSVSTQKKYKKKKRNKVLLSTLC